MPEPGILRNGPYQFGSLTAAGLHQNNQQRLVCQPGGP